MCKISNHEILLKDLIDLPENLHQQKFSAIQVPVANNCFFVVYVVSFWFGLPQATLPLYNVSALMVPTALFARGNDYSSQFQRHSQPTADDQIDCDIIQEYNQIP